MVYNKEAVYKYREAHKDDTNDYYNNLMKKRYHNNIEKAREVGIQNYYKNIDGFKAYYEVNKEKILLVQKSKYEAKQFWKKLCLIELQ